MLLVASSFPSLGLQQTMLQCIIRPKKRSHDPRSSSSQWETFTPSIQTSFLKCLSSKPAKWVLLGLAPSFVVEVAAVGTSGIFPMLLLRHKLILHTKLKLTLENFITNKDILLEGIWELEICKYKWFRLHGIINRQKNCNINNLLPEHHVGTLLDEMRRWIEMGRPSFKLCFP